MPLICAQYLKKPVNKIGVVHREMMADLIKTNARFCEAEGIELIAISLPDRDKNFPKTVRKSLRTLKKMGIDALWVLNDNALLKGPIIKHAWTPELRKSNFPVIVGVESLISSKLNFGTFAIVPDLYALGVQGASVLAEIMDDDWILEGREVEQPLSVKKILNLDLSNKRKIGINMGALRSIDSVIR